MDIVEKHWPFYFGASTLLLATIGATHVFNLQHYRRYAVCALLALIISPMVFLLAEPFASQGINQVYKLPLPLELQIFVAWATRKLAPELAVIPSLVIAWVIQRRLEPRDAGEVQE